MNAKTRILLIAAGSVGLGVTGYGLLRVGTSQIGYDIKPVPLTTGPGAVTLLPEPANSPYEALIDRAIQTAPALESESRQQLLNRIRELRTRWKFEDGLAAAPTERKNQPGRL